MHAAFIVTSNAGRGSSTRATQRVKRPFRRRGCELYINRFLPKGKAVITGNEPPDGISGIINIEPRKTRELQIPVYVLGSIRGRVLNAPGEPVDGAHIKLYYERHFDHPEPGGVWIDEMKLTGMHRAGEDGRFLFRGVKPG